MSRYDFTMIFPLKPITKNPQTAYIFPLRIVLFIHLPLLELPAALSHRTSVSQVHGKLFANVAPNHYVNHFLGANGKIH